MLHHREERFPARTLSEFVGRGLYPCNGCVQAALQCNGEPLFGRRVYTSGVKGYYPMVSGACQSCGFFVWSNGKITVPFNLMREMCRRETKEDRRGPNVEVDDGPCVPTGGEPIVRHGDKKTSFGTGAQRDTDEGKGTPSLISPVLIHRLGVLLAEGAKHYGADNWMKGMPYRRTVDSMIRHIFQWLAGDKAEDHLAAVCFGAMCLMTYESDKVLDQKLDDRDEGLTKILASILTSPPKDTTLKVDSVYERPGAFVGSEQPQASLKMCIKNCGKSTVSSSGICVDCERILSDAF